MPRTPRGGPNGRPPTPTTTVDLPAIGSTRASVRAYQEALASALASGALPTSQAKVLDGIARTVLASLRDDAHDEQENSKVTRGRGEIDELEEMLEKAKAVKTLAAKRAAEKRQHLKVEDAEEPPPRAS